MWAQTGMEMRASQTTYGTTCGSAIVDTSDAATTMQAVRQKLA